jgi:hypothetical protein
MEGERSNCGRFEEERCGRTEEEPLERFQSEDFESKTNIDVSFGTMKLWEVDENSRNLKKAEEF